MGSDVKAPKRPMGSAWTVWIHMAHDTNWTLSSYIKICKTDDLDEFLLVMKSIEDLVLNCMVFVMRGDIVPMWENEMNRGGGAFSYKIPEDNVMQFWTTMLFKIVGSTLTVQPSAEEYVNGITVSPKKNFHIIKVWMRMCPNVESLALSDDVGIQHEGRVYSAFC